MDLNHFFLLVCFGKGLNYSKKVIEPDRFKIDVSVTLEADWNMQMRSKDLRISQFMDRFLNLFKIFVLRV